jgi:hypothetical protein
MIATYGMPLEVVQDLISEIYGLGVMKRMNAEDAMPAQWERICRTIHRATYMPEDVRFPLDIDCGEY